MLRKVTAALAAAALLAASPALAQAAAKPLEVAPAAETVGGAGESALGEERGAAFYVIAAIAIGLVAWGIWELIDDEESESP